MVSEEKKIDSVLVYDAVHSGTKLPTYRKNILSLSSGEERRVVLGELCWESCAAVRIAAAVCTVTALYCCSTYRRIKFHQKAVFMNCRSCFTVAVRKCLYTRRLPD
jgi:hypothetical protein